MLIKAIRDNAKHFYWILALAGLSLFFLDPALTQSVGGIFSTPDRSDSAAASVGDAEITFSDLERQYRNLEARYQEMFGEQWSSEMAEQLNIGRQALEQLVNREVLLLEAERLGLAVTDEEVRRAVLEIPAFQSEGRFIGGDRYRQVLRSNGYTAESFEEALRTDLLTQKITQVLGQNLYLTDAEVEDAYRRQVEQASIRYVQMPLTRFSQEATASQEELEAYLEQNLAEFQLPEQREVSYLLVDRNMMRDRVEVPEEELRTYYEDNPDEFSREAQVQARHILLRTGERTPEEASRELEAIRQRIEGGEDFAAVAREVSEDPGSAQRGGDLGMFGRGQMVPEFEEAAFSAEGDELVGPVESPFGVHLLQVTDRREAGQQSFEEAREGIRFRLAQDRLATVAEEHAAELASRLAEGEVDAEALRAQAEGDAAVFFYEPAPFGRGDAVAGIGRAPEFTEAAFSLPEGELSGPVEVPRGWAVILAEDILMPRPAELAEVEPQVRRAVETERRRELVNQALTEARERLAQGATLDEVAGELGLTVSESQPFGADGNIVGLGSLPQLARAALAMEEGEVGGPVETPQGAVLYEVSERTAFDPQQFAAAKEQTRQTLLSERAGLLQNSLIQQRREELGVTYSRSVVDQYDLAGAES